MHAGVHRFRVPVGDEDECERERTTRELARRHERRVDDVEALPLQLQDVAAFACRHGCLAEQEVAVLQSFS